MSCRSLGTWLSLAHQTLSLEVDFGAHALEALLWVAETVEESVYEPRSLVRSQGELSFALANPPLRAGAFHAVRVALDGTVLPVGELELRAGEGRPWTQASSVNRASPFTFDPGRRTEIRVRAPGKPLSGAIRVRVELESVAIPPLVWLEFQDTPREGPSP